MKITKQYAMGMRKIAEQGTTLLPDQEVLAYLDLVPVWKIGVAYNIDDRVTVKDEDALVLYKCRQAHTSQEDWKPSPATASLWTRIDEMHKGTKEDPIPAAVNMEYTKGLYYSENGELYLCTRDSGQPLAYVPSQLVGIYFEKV